jgi:CRISPR system Cascade subunit CasE
MLTSTLHISRLRLSVPDLLKLRIKDAYGIHRVVYDLFEQVRCGADEKDLSSGILYVDKGMKKGWREVIMVSNRSPHPPTHGDLNTQSVKPELLSYSSYRFEITINPVKRENDSRKIVPLRTREAVTEWFTAKAPKWGFEPTFLEVRSMDVIQFDKAINQSVTLGQATLTGHLKVTDPDRFARSFEQGIGRGKAFGCGLLQIVPISS